MLFNKKWGWVVSIPLGYILIGGVYYLSSYLFQQIIGKEIVFAPIVGLPLTILGWPWMVYADLLHHQSLGIKPPAIVALITLIGLITLLIFNIKNTHKASL